MTDYADKPAEEIMQLMNQWIEQGWNCFVKWTCENCGERCVCNTPNLFTIEYFHEDCGHTSHPTKFGLMVMGVVKGGKNESNKL